MEPNIHRYVFEYRDWLGNRNQFKTTTYTNEPAYLAGRPQQNFSIWWLNDLERGNREDERMGSTVYQKEIRLKLCLRCWDTSIETEVARRAMELTLEGVQNNNFKTVRQYSADINSAGINISGNTSTGSLDGANFGVEATAIALLSTSQNVTSQGSTGGKINISDTHPNTVPAYTGNALVTFDNRLLNYNYQVNVERRFRVLLIKYFDKILPDDTSIDYWLQPRGFVPDVSGPTEFLGNDTYQLGHLTYPAVIPITQSLRDSVYKNTDILYDKVFTFKLGDSTANIDEVWQLNEQLAFYADTEHAIDNGIVLIIYDQPGSVMQNADGPAAVRNFLPMYNNLFVEFNAELYYNQNQ